MVPPDITQLLNSLVLLSGSVAVAVTTNPFVTVTPVNVEEKVTCPDAFVVTIADPRKTCPSPNPDPSHVGLA
jgi:hypothetical protein